MTTSRENIWKKIKLPNKSQLIVLLLVGMLLAVIAIPVPGGRNTKSSKEEAGAKEEQGKSYQAALEEELAQTLQSVEGVGDVKVMLTLKSSTEKIVEKDVAMRESNEEETTVYEETNSGVQTPYIKKELTPEVAGVLVIASGGDNPVAKQNITEAVKALFNVDTHKIKIMKLKS